MTANLSLIEFFYNQLVFPNNRTNIDKQQLHTLHFNNKNVISKIYKTTWLIIHAA